MQQYLVETIHDEGGWKYRIFNHNALVDELDPFQSIAELWNSKRNGRKLPAWRDFELEDFAGWYGNLIVQDIIFEEPLDFYFRLWGTKVVDIFNIDLTGKRARTAPGHHFNQFELDLIARFAEESIIVISSGTIHWQNRDHINVQVLELPLADNGVDVDKVLGVFYLPK